MNWKETHRLRKQIDNTDGYRVAGTEDYGKGSYSINVVCNDGTSIVIHNEDQWRTRMLDQKLARAVED